VEKYKNIHRQGFNFSPKFECKFHDEYEKYIDEDGEEKERLKDNCKLDIKPKEHIENFFGNNINVTAIVGKNGSGKSSLVESLQAINIINPIQGESNFDSKYLLILKIDKDSFEEDDFLSVNEHIQIKTNIDDLNHRIGEQFYENIDFLFEPLFFDAELPYNKFNEYEIVSENFYAVPEFEHIKEYAYIDLDYNSISKKLLQINKNDLLNTFDFIPESLRINQKENTLEKSRNFIVDDYHRRPRFSDEVIEKVDDIIETIIDGKDFFIFSLFLSNIDNFEEKKIIEILDQINLNDNIAEILKPYLSKLDTDINLDEYETLLTENIKISNVDKNLLIKYAEYLDIEILDGKIRSFNNLSHGEKMFFGVMINISYFFQESRSKNFVLFFDEPDLSLHPNWQKRYMQEIYNLLKQFDNKIHLIFTTHSPFLLSDIPKQNIIFLDTHKEEDIEVKEEKQKVGNCRVIPHDEVMNKKQTFGANIHTLLSDSFFMEDGLMGEFAKGKINEIIAFHKEAEENKKEKSNCFSLRRRYLRLKTKFWQTQSIIGEDYLKQVIKNHLVEIEKILLGKDMAKKEEITRTKKYLKSLEDE
jgi:predicted ATPase